MSEKIKSKSKLKGKQSVCFTNPPIIIGRASVVGKKEGEGPLGAYFDIVEEDPMFGGNSWEEAESQLLLKAASQAISSTGLKNKDIRYFIGGDLLGQLIATSFGMVSLEIPMIGVYGACSTMGESIMLGAMLIDGGFADRLLAITSSHFAGAEKQFRFPLAYGNQRPLAATWTVTGSGAVIIADSSCHQKNQIPPDEAQVIITGATVGKIVDFGIKDSMNMGACMAPAASATISQNFRDFGVDASYYDKIITGDLGSVGRDILYDLVKQEGFDISKNHIDCGIEIFDPETQDTHSGGSGCGCSAVTLTGYILQKIIKNEWKRILFVPTGALLSPVSFNEGQSVPGIAHAVVLESNGALTGKENR